MKTQIKKVLSVLMCICLLLSSVAVMASAEETTTATISFADTAQRTVYTTEQQVWVQNGITVTNDKGASTTAVGNYSNPARFYANSTVTIEFATPIIQFVVDTSGSKYATALQNSITSGATLTANGNVVTVVLDTPATSFSFKCSGQNRAATITVTAQAATGGETTDPETPVEPEEPTVNYDALNAAITEANGLTEDTYTTDSWANLETALADATAALESTDQTVVDAATTALNAAIDALVVYEEPEEPVDPSLVPATSTLTFDDTAKRTVGTTEQQVWVENYLTVTNNKGSSTTNVNTGYFNPVRFYKNSEVVIEYPVAMTKIELVANSATYATYTANSITSGGTVTTSGSVVTVVLDTPATSFTFNCTANQLRFNAITVYTAGAVEEPPYDPTGKTSAEIVEAAHALAAGKTIENATVTGTVTVINTAYSEQYANITITLAVEGTDKTIMCYRLVADANNAENIKNIVIDDILTVTGNIEVYNGTPQFAEDSVLTAYESGGTVIVVPEDPKEIVDAAYALTAGTTLPYEATLTGTITEIGTAYSEQYGNVTLTIAVEGKEDKPIICYRLKAADGHDASSFRIGDVISVTGYIKNYNGTIEFDQGCLGAMVTAHTHNFVAGAVTAPTCTTAGYTTYTCSICGDTKTDDAVAALGHTAGADADCENAQVCAVCGEELNGAIGHDYESAVTVVPTTTTKGEKTFTCANCGDTYTEEMDVLPQAIVENLGATTTTIDSYYIYNLQTSSLTTASGGFNMQMTMDFTAPEADENGEYGYYEDHYTDFFIEMNGLSADKVSANGCYLAGYYESFGAWVVIPLDGFEIEDGFAYPVISIAGFNFTYETICTDVKNFKCGIYLSDEFLAANPNVEVTLNLGLTEEPVTDITVEAPFYTVDNYTYDEEDLSTPVVAEVNGIKFYDLQQAVDYAKEGATVELVADVELDATVVISNDIVLDLGGYTVSAKDGATFVPMFRVLADVTVTNGTIDGRAAGAYAFIVGSSSAEGTLTIVDGTFYGDTSAVSVT
ncbi:MAG: hypothetical protein IJN65_04570 [Clostridia bacterium]|nr:hypothetical protein [Clostridia bacterium]